MTKVKKIFIGVIVLIFLIITIFLMTKKKESFKLVQGTIENATKGGDKKIVLTDNDGNLSSIPSFNGLVPSGLISAWSGSDIPKDWAICDGKSYDRTTGTESTATTSNDNKITTPDLRGRFIIGVSADYELGKTGGSDKISVDQLPSHTHQYKDTIYTNRSEYASPNRLQNFGGNDKLIGSKSSYDDVNSRLGVYDTTDPTGKGDKFLPPYYVLIYIMKL